MSDPNLIRAASESGADSTGSPLPLVDDTTRGPLGTEPGMGLPGTSRDVGSGDLDEMLTAETRPAAPIGKPRSLWSDAWRDLRRNPLFIGASIILAFWVVVAIWPTLLTGSDPTYGDLDRSLQGPSSEHPFGTTRQGYDLYARVIYGARASITVGVVVTLGVSLLGGTIGSIAAYFGGWVDSLLSRITEVFFAIPLLLGAIVFMQGTRERTIWTVCMALVILGWPGIMRIMRGAVIQVKEADFVTAARALGASPLRIMLRHILPNAIAPVIVMATIALGTFIVTEATLSFLGIGLPSSVVSWGQDISTAQRDFRRHFELLAYPGGALFLTVLSFMLMGDAVRDALDPKLR